MRPTGKIHPITHEEIMEIEASDVKWNKEWSEMTLDEKADYCSFKKIEFVSKAMDIGMGTYYKKDRELYGKNNNN